MGKTHFSTLSENSNILFTCEHATSRIPEELGTLGLSREDLDNCKDLYDPGALELAQALAKEFDASLLWSDLSRLVIDMNRYFDAPGKNKNSFHASLLKKELLTMRAGKEILLSIPHNQTLSEKEERELYDTVCVPYQEEMLRIVQKLKEVHEHVYIVSVHSFFPEYNGSVRTVDIDVMGYVHPEVAPKVCEAITAGAPNYTTEIDKPWSVMDVDGGAMHVLEKEPGVTVLAFDIKNDNLGNDTDVKKMSDALKAGIRAIDG